VAGVEGAAQRLSDRDLAARLVRAVATGYARVLAPKDEYEVARLLTSPDPRVRAAVVEAAAAIDNEPARTILRRGLADPDIGVIGTAADGIEKNADHFRTVTSPRTEPPLEPRADGGVPPIREPERNDILVFDSTATVENSIKLVMPSATQPMKSSNAPAAMNAIPG